jgi:hypothetical protein
MLVYQRVHWRGGTASPIPHISSFEGDVWNLEYEPAYPHWWSCFRSFIHWDDQIIPTERWGYGYGRWDGHKDCRKTCLKNHTFYLTDMLALWHAIWQILHDKIRSYSLTFYLLYLTRILTSNLAFYLTYIPTFYWTNIVKVWQIYLTCILTFYLAFALADYLTLYLAFPSDTFWHLSDKYSRSFWHFAWHMFWQFISPTIHRLPDIYSDILFWHFAWHILTFQPWHSDEYLLAHNPGHVFEKVPTWQIFWPLIWNVYPLVMTNMAMV